RIVPLQQSPKERVIPMSLADTKPIPKKQIYVLVVAALVLMVSNGLTFAGMTVFDSSILDELGMTVSQLKFRETILYALAAMLAPLAGYLVDRIGVKPLMVFGLVVLSICLFFYSKISSLSDLYIIYIGVGAALKGCGLMVCVILVSRWFGPWRGRALGFLVSGSSLGNALLPQLNSSLLGEFGWRTALTLLAIMPLALLPLVAMLPKTTATSATAATPDANETGPDDSANYWEALRSVRFWLLGIIAFTTFFALMGSTTNFVLHMQRDLGLPLERADDSLTILFVVAIITKLIGGVIADRIGPKPVLIACLVTMLAGAITLTQMSTTLVWYGITLFGLGWGALYTMIQLLPSKMFGLASLGKIFGTLVVFETTAGAIGPYVVGLGYDRTGDYQLSFTIVSVMLAVALLCAILIKPRSHVAV
ncbi:MAG: MFS transporter, partial [Gammaproteobacteria bacterium]